MILYTVSHLLNVPISSSHTGCRYLVTLGISTQNDTAHQGPFVQSVVSLTSSLRVISLTVLADSIHNSLIFFAENATHIFSAKNFSIFAYHSM